MCIEVLMSINTITNAFPTLQLLTISHTSMQDALYDPAYYAHDGTKGLTLYGNIYPILGWRTYKSNSYATPLTVSIQSEKHIILLDVTVPLYSYRTTDGRYTQYMNEEQMKQYLIKNFK